MPIKKYNFGNINHVDVEFYINRQKAFDKLAEVISSGGSAQVKGAPRVGKTAFVRNFRERFNRYKKGFEFRYITFKGGEIDPLCDIVDQLKAMLSSDMEIAKRNKKKRVVIFDEFGSAVLLTQDNGRLVGLLNYVQVLLNCGIQLVIVAQQSLYGAMSDCNVGKAFLPARETIEEVEITAFSENEFKEYCAHSLAPVDGDMLKAAFDKTRGIAGAINIVLNKLNRFYDSSARRFSNTLITQVSILDEPDVKQNLKYILSPTVERSTDNAVDTECGDTSSQRANMGAESMSLMADFIQRELGQGPAVEGNIATDGSRIVEEQKHKGRPPGSFAYHSELKGQTLVDEDGYRDLLRIGDDGQTIYARINGKPETVRMTGEKAWREGFELAFNVCVKNFRYKSETWKVSINDNIRRMLAKVDLFKKKILVYDTGTIKINQEIFNVLPPALRDSKLS